MSYTPSSDLSATLKRLFPGARVTSTDRTPAQNRAVGGAANSFHLRGAAVDFVPAGGMASVSKTQVQRALESVGLQIRELLGPGDRGHNDHFHVVTKGNASGAADTGQGLSRAWLNNALGDTWGNWLADGGEGVGDALQAPGKAVAGIADAWVLRGAFAAVALLLIAAGLFMLAKQANITITPAALKPA